MVETLNHPETEKPQEHHEQSPEQFIESLGIFDSYVDIPEGKEREPEHQMPFTERDQELAVGIRGTLAEMAEAAMRENKAVSIPELFTAFENSLRESAADEQTKDELFLVATKMRYHMQLRYDKAQENEPVQESAPRASTIYEAAMLGDQYLNEYISSSLKKPRLADEWLRDAQQVADTTDHEWNDWLSGRKEELGDEEFESETNNTPKPEAREPKRDYDAEARDIINKRTEGTDFNSLDRKQRGKVTRGLARDYHPDLGGDEELYKAITEQTAEDASQVESDTQSY